MAKIIEFVVPSSFRKKAAKWIPPEENGKVIPFVLPSKVGESRKAADRSGRGDASLAGQRRYEAIRQMLALTAFAPYGLL